jgi:hypothetical protein
MLANLFKLTLKRPHKKFGGPHFGHVCCIWSIGLKRLGWESSYLADQYKNYYTVKAAECDHTDNVIIPLMLSLNERPGLSVETSNN